MQRAPIKASLTIAAYSTRERGRFVVSCPALRLAAQGKTLAEAQREFLGLFTANLEYWQKGGHLEGVMHNALADPDTRIVPTGAKRQPMILPIPAKLTAAVYGKKSRLKH